MARPLPPNGVYAGRASEMKILNVAIDKDADAILRQYAGDGRRPIGRFVERLIFEFAAREEGRKEERAKIQAEQAAK